MNKIDRRIRILKYSEHNSKLLCKPVIQCSQNPVVLTKQCRFKNTALFCLANTWFFAMCCQKLWHVTDWNYWPALFCRDYQKSTTSSEQNYMLPSSFERILRKGLKENFLPWMATKDKAFPCPWWILSLSDPEKCVFPRIRTITTGRLKFLQIKYFLLQ